MTPLRAVRMWLEGRLTEEEALRLSGAVDVDQMRAWSEAWGLDELVEYLADERDRAQQKTRRPPE